MARPFVFIIASLLILAVLPFFITHAYAKGVSYSQDYAIGQYMLLVLMPALVAVGSLIMIALYTRQNQKLTAK